MSMLNKVEDVGNSLSSLASVSSCLFIILGLSTVLISCGPSLLSAINASTSSSSGSKTGTNVTGSNGSLSALIPQGLYSGTTTATMSDTNLIASNILSGATIFGTSGSVTTAALFASNAHRDAASVPTYISGVQGSSGGTYTNGTETSLQLTQAQEYSTYGYSSTSPQLLPSRGGYNYRDIPDQSKDDDGYGGTSITHALRPQSACGSGATIAARIADCLSKNPSTATWNGATITGTRVRRHGI